MRQQYNSIESDDWEQSSQFSHQQVPDASTTNKKSVSSRAKYIAAVGGTMLMAGLVVFMLTTTGPANRSSAISSLVASNYPRTPLFGADSILITASDEYGDTAANKFTYPFLASALLASPYKTTTFSITNTGSGCSYDWVLKDMEGNVIDNGDTTDGTMTTSELKLVGQYVLSVAESDCDDGSSRSIDQSVWVKYVRRELTSLTDDDREAFLNAFSTLWSVNTIDGQALYGENYKSLYYFASIHNDAGANSVCDEFHGDQGFVNNHMMLGAYLEQSLQLVDPSTCLHYMEYAVYFESDNFTEHMSNQLDGGAWTEIFSSKWFGANDPVTGRIVDGRWENASVPRLTEQFYIDHGIDKDALWFPAEEESWYRTTDQSHLMNPYGLLRSPWNWNPNEFVSRFNNVNLIEDISGIDSSIRSFYSGVKCADFQNFIEDEVMGNPFCDFLHYAEDNVHGKIHFTFGGAGGDYADATNKILKDTYNLTDAMLILVAQGDQTFVKQAYPLFDSRGFYDIPYPFNCTTFPWDQDTETLLTTESPGSEEAICTLNPYYCESQDHMTSLYHKYLAPFQDKSKGSQYSLEAMLLDLDLDTQCEIADIFVGRAAYDGDMAGSGAALDPLFWVAHGAVERLMQKVVFAGITTDTTYDVSSSMCSGHMNDGTKAWLKGFYFVDTSIVAENLTNVDLNGYLNPTTDEYRDNFNFIYDIDNYNFCSGASDWFTTRK